MESVAKIYLYVQMAWTFTSFFARASKRICELCKLERPGAQLYELKQLKHNALKPHQMYSPFHCETLACFHMK